MSDCLEREGSFDLTWNFYKEDKNIAMFSSVFKFLKLCYIRLMSMCYLLSY